MTFLNPEKLSNQYLSDPDVKLMLNFQKGDKASFEVLMRKYFPPLMNFIYKFVYDRESAEDITQEVFIRVYNSCLKYEAKSSFKTWVYTIARNLALNEVRRNKHATVSLNRQIDTGENAVLVQMEDVNAVMPPEEMIKEERKKVIQNAINELSNNQRMAVMLRRYDEFSYEEIAKIMGVSMKAVKSLLSRAKESLKKSLEHFIKNDH